VGMVPVQHMNACGPPARPGAASVTFVLSTHLYHSVSTTISPAGLFWFALPCHSVLDRKLLTVSRHNKLWRIQTGTTYHKFNCLTFPPYIATKTHPRMAEAAGTTHDLEGMLLSCHGLSTSCLRSILLASQTTQAHYYLHYCGTLAPYCKRFIRQPPARRRGHRLVIPTNTILRRRCRLYRAFATYAGVCRMAAVAIYSTSAAAPVYIPA